MMLILVCSRISIFQRRIISDACIWCSRRKSCFNLILIVEKRSSPEVFTEDNGGRVAAANCGCLAHVLLSCVDFSAQLFGLSSAARRGAAQGSVCRLKCILGRPDANGFWSAHIWWTTLLEFQTAVGRRVAARRGRTWRSVLIVDLNRDILTPARQQHLQVKTARLREAIDFFLKNAAFCSYINFR